MSGTAGYHEQYFCLGFCVIISGGLSLCRLALDTINTLFSPLTFVLREIDTQKIYSNFFPD